MASRPLPLLLPLRSSLLPSTPLLPFFSHSSLRSHATQRRPFLRAPPMPPRKPGAVAAPPVVVLDDEKYGKKQVISLTPRLYQYILSNVREPPVLRELREETATRGGSQMQVSPDQAQLLAMLVQILGAKQCIELGIYTGYSSLAIALALPESGRLVACERDGTCLDIAKKYYERAGVAKKVDIKHGVAVETLKSLIQNGESSRLGLGGLLCLIMFFGMERLLTLR